MPQSAEPLLFVKVNEEVFGPYPASRVGSFIEEGRVKPRTLVAETRDGVFTPARETPLLAAWFDAPADTPAAPGPTDAFTADAGGPDTRDVEPRRTAPTSLRQVVRDTIRSADGEGSNGAARVLRRFAPTPPDPSEAAGGDADDDAPLRPVTPREPGRRRSFRDSRPDTDSRDTDSRDTGVRDAAPVSDADHAPVGRFDAGGTDGARADTAFEDEFDSPIRSLRETRRAPAAKTGPRPTPAPRRNRQHGRPAAGGGTPLFVLVDGDPEGVDVIADAIRELGPAAQATDTSWFVAADASADAARNRLSRLLGVENSLVVLDLSADHAAWFNLGADRDAAIRRLREDEDDARA